MGNGGQNRSLRQLRSPRRWRQQAGGWSGVSSSSRHTHPGDAGPSHIRAHTATLTPGSHTQLPSHTPLTTHGLCHTSGPHPTQPHTQMGSCIQPHVQGLTVSCLPHTEIRSPQGSCTPQESLSPPLTQTHTRHLSYTYSLSLSYTHSLPRSLILTHEVHLSKHTESVSLTFTQNLSDTETHRISLT